MVDLDRAISSAMKSGKVLIGSKKAIYAAKSGRATVLIVASNCPVKILHDIKYYSDISKILLYTYPASSLDLGIACGKPFAISALAIREINEPDFLRIKQVEKSG